MHVKIEPSGCCERKGMVQVRFDFFLDEGDHGYKTRGNAPFHSHFVYVDPDATEKQILDIGERLLKQAYGFWEKDQFPALVNAPHTPPETTPARKVACMDKADRFKTEDASKLVRKV